MHYEFELRFVSVRKVHSTA